MMRLHHDVFLDDGARNLISLNQNIFSYRLNGVQFLVYTKLSKENLTESASSQYLQQLEVFEFNFCQLFGKGGLALDN
jgi:hypothetical protein